MVFSIVQEWNSCSTQIRRTNHCHSQIIISKQILSNDVNVVFVISHVELFSFKMTAVCCQGSVVVNFPTTRGFQCRYGFVVDLHGPQPVSYTHLDVYKRQITYCTTDLVYNILIYMNTKCRPTLRTVLLI